MAKKEINEERFNQMREMLASAECATKTVPLASIQLDENSFNRNEIQIGGAPVKVSNGFFQKLASTLKVSRSLTNEMIKNEDGKIAVSLMNGLKDYRQSRDAGGEIMLIANPNSREVIDLCDPKRFRRMTNESVFDVTSNIINDNPNLSIETIDFDPRNGKAVINLLNAEEVGFPGAGKDEFFKFGFSIVQTNKDTYVETYNQRLVCSNGLRVSLGQGAIGGNRDIQFEERFRLGGTSAEEIKIFLNQINAMNKAGFIPGGFQSALNAAVNTKASLFEIEEAMLIAQRMVRDDDPTMKKAYIDTVARQYFHSHADTMARIVKKGQDPTRLNDKQKGFIRTGMSIWDVVNSMTFLGSNDSGIPLSNRHELKESAGRLFGKGTKDGYDLQFAQYAQL
jgi:hypothetical protein